MFFLLTALSYAQDVTLQNDTAINNSFGLSDMVAWLEYPECVVSVLTPDPSDLPLDIHTVQIYLGSQFGTLDNISTSVMMGIQQLDLSETPSGYGNWAWPISVFTTTSTTRRS